MALCGLRGWPFSPNRLAFGLFLPPFTFVNLTKSHSYVKDIFTIRLIVIKYRNGVASSEVFRGGRRGAALRACVA